MSDSVRPHRQQPTRLCCHWDSPGKNTGVGCHFLLQCMKVKSEREVAQSCPTLSDPWAAAHQAPLSMRFSRQGYWSGLPFPSPGGLPNPGIEPGSPVLQADSLPTELQVSYYVITKYYFYLPQFYVQIKAEVTTN